MNYYAITALINAVTSLGLGAFVALRSWKSVVSRRFVFFALSVGIWSVFYCLWQVESSARPALLWTRVLMGSAIWIPTAFLHFVFVLIGTADRPENKRLLFIAYSLSLVYFLSDFGPWFVAVVVPRAGFKFWPVPGLLFHPFLAQFIGSVVYAHVLLYRAIRQSPSAIFRNQARYVFLGTLIGYAGGATNFPLWYDIPIFPIGNGLVAVYIFMVAYAIARYRLMDITIAITRTAIFVIVYSVIVGIPLLSLLSFRSILAKGLGDFWWLLPVGAVGYALLASIAPLVFVFFQRKAEGRLLREQRRYQTMLLSSAKGMTQIHNLERLLKLLAYLLVRAMKLTHVGIFLWDEGRDQYVLQVQVRPPCQAATPSAVCETHEPLVLWLKQERAPVVREEIGQLAEAKRGRTVSLSRLESRLKTLEAAVVVPSFVNDRLIGFLALGPKRAGTMYSDDDLNMLQTLANQAALAIENAQFYQQERERQAQLSHAASIADLGTMASSMSHQLNNPFCIISGTAQNREEYLRRLLEQPNALPEAMRRLIQEEVASLQSIREEATEGANIIATIRGITASQEAARPLLLAEVIKVALPIAQYKVPFNRLDFRQELPEDLPRIWGSRAQLAQCLISFIENAWDAIERRQERLKPPPDYKGLIRLAASAVTEPDRAAKPERTSWVVLTVSDNGIGLKPEDLRKLFIPFFTTKATAEKAFGSLFVVRRIIEAHEGAVTADSTYGTGTTLKVRLPALTDEELERRMAQARATGNGTGPAG